MKRKAEQDSTEMEPTVASARVDSLALLPITAILSARTTVCDTRAEAHTLVLSGRIQLESRLGEPPKTVDCQIRLSEDEAQRLLMDGEALPVAPLRYVLFNKPRGVVTANKRDPSDPLKPTVIEVLAANGLQQAGQLFAVGRLDAESEGLLLLTNDGPLCHRLTAPSFKVPKAYLAIVRARQREPPGRPTHFIEESLLQKLCAEGISLGRDSKRPYVCCPISMQSWSYDEADGALGGTLLDRIEEFVEQGDTDRKGRDATKEGTAKLQYGPTETSSGIAAARAKEAGLSLVEIVIDEGKRHEVRKLFHEVGFSTLRLIRLRHGELKDTELLSQSGSFRVLSHDELQAAKSRSFASGP